MVKFRTARSGSSILIFEDHFRYMAELNPEDLFAPYNGVFISYPMNGSRVNVSSRGLRDYPSGLKNNLNPGLKYLEVGPGLAEFIPHLVKLQSGTTVKPIAIDPVNYNLIGELLQYASTLNISQGLVEKIRILTERCNVFLDQSKVELFNMTLGQALDEHPELIGVADVVVEKFGPSAYAGTENQDPYVFRRSLDSKLRYFLSGPGEIYHTISHADF